MDTTKAIYIPIHEHPLFPSARFVNSECFGCHVQGTIYEGYVCNEEAFSSLWIHKECAEAPPVINHPSHAKHPLLLTNKVGVGPCDLCGEKLLPPCYRCTTCQFKLDFICGIKPPSPAIEHPMCHDHPLIFLKKRGKRKEMVPCNLCKESIGGASYLCLECKVYFHVDCAHLSKEVNHPIHASHPLRLIDIASASLAYEDESICFVCRVQPEIVLYRCSTCNFNLCLVCTKNPPPLILQRTKTHKHPLALVSSEIRFICKVCGVFYEYGSICYVCIKCWFFVHGCCIGLPQVININRHEHRISLTHRLGHRGINCGICRQGVSQYYGAYSCSVCPNYTVHTRCTYDVCDAGVDLAGIPETSENIAPFEVVGDNLISHFSHEGHTLRFNKDKFIYDECIRCDACIHPIGLGFDPFYSCEKCCFFLHEKCANLPRKKYLVFAAPAFTLSRFWMHIDCIMCGMLSHGLKYTATGRSDVDVHCASLSEPLVHVSHLHPLYFEQVKGHLCDTCKRGVDGYLLRCNACDFDLCFYCATLPEKISHSSDEHPLILHCNENVSGQNWCNICERELDPSKCFFACFDCGVTLHVQCVLGDFSRLLPESIFDIEGEEFKVVLNNLNTRPLCNQCHSRCNASIILKDRDEDDNGYICSRSCLMRLFDKKHIDNLLGGFSHLRPGEKLTLNKKNI